MTETRFCKDHHQATENYHDKGTGPFPQKWAESVGGNLFRHCLAVPRNSREHRATKQSQVRSPWQTAERQYSFLLQPLNLSPSVTIRNLISLTSTPRADAGIGSLNVLRVVTTTFLSDELTWKSAWLSQLSVLQFSLSSKKEGYRSVIFRRAISQRNITSPALSIQLGALLSWERLEETLKHTL